MSLRIATAISAFVVLALAGCATSLNVQRVAPGTAPPADQYFYVLPYTQFKVTVTRRVSSCEMTHPVTHQPLLDAHGAHIPDMRIQTKVSFATQQADDRQNQYAIDASSLRHAFNAAKLELEFRQGTSRLQSINASIEGQGAAAARFLIPAVGKLATVLAGAAGPGSPVCSAEVTAAVSRAVEQKRRVKELTEQVEDLTARVTQLRARRAGLAEGLNSVVSRPLAHALDELETKAEELAQAEAALNETLESITATSEYVWPNASSEYAGGLDHMDMDTFATWVSIYQRRRNADGSFAETAQQWRTRTHPLIEQNESYQSLNVRLFLEPQSADFGAQIAPGPSLTPPGERPPRETTDGVRYRLPAPGRIVACSGATPATPPPPTNFHGAVLNACGAANAHNTEYANEVGRSETNIAQLGYVQRLPLRAHAFESASFSATFDEGGGLTKSGYQTTGGGAALTELLSLGLTQAAAVREAQNAREQGEAARDRDRAQALLAAAQADAALGALNDPGTIETTTLNAETTLLRARIAREEADRVWRALNPTTP